MLQCGVMYALDTVYVTAYVLKGCLMWRLQFGVMYALKTAYGTERVYTVILVNLK